MKTAWVFPGQGSQTVGMGQDLLDLLLQKSGFSRQSKFSAGLFLMFACKKQNSSARSILNPCLYTVCAILADLLQQQGNRPDFVAGHSVGEYVALYVADVFSFEVGLQLIKQRSECMDRINTGIMVALIGVDRPQLAAQLQQTPNVVLANDNHPGQVVISGLPDAVNALMAKVKVRRSVPLKVSGAFHSPLVADAEAAFRPILQATPFRSAQMPVLSNTAPTPATDAEILKARLMTQIAGSVRWREISLQLPIEEVERVIEVGPGTTLTGLIQRTCDNLILENVSSFSYPLELEWA